MCHKTCHPDMTSSHWWTGKEEDGTQKEKIEGTGGVMDIHIIRVHCIYVSNCQK